MHQSQLEKTIQNLPIEFPDDTRKASFYYSTGLYEASIGTNDLDFKMLETYGQNLKKLTLPERLIIYRDLRKEGKRYIKDGEVRKGAHCFATAHYFWQNFIVLEGNKS